MPWCIKGQTSSATTVPRDKKNWSLFLVGNPAPPPTYDLLETPEQKKTMKKHEGKMFSVEIAQDLQGIKKTTFLHTGQFCGFSRYTLNVDVAPPIFDPLGTNQPGSE